jgi:hypothetical protein
VRDAEQAPRCCGRRLSVGWVDRRPRGVVMGIEQCGTPSRRRGAAGGGYRWGGVDRRPREVVIPSSSAGRPTGAVLRARPSAGLRQPHREVVIPHRPELPARVTLVSRCLAWSGRWQGTSCATVPPVVSKPSGRRPAVTVLLRPGYESSPPAQGPAAGRPMPRGARAGENQVRSRRRRVILDERTPSERIGCLRRMARKGMYGKLCEHYAAISEQVTPLPERRFDSVSAASLMFSTSPRRGGTDTRQVAGPPRAHPRDHLSTAGVCAGGG